MKAEDIEKRQSTRLKLLYDIYKSGLSNYDIRKSAFNIEIRNGIFEEALDYLQGEDFVKMTDKSIGKITHKGKKVIEAAVLNSNKRTEHFPPFDEVII